MNIETLKIPRRGRPSRTPEQLEESRRLIVKAAKELFLTEGYDGVSMRKIAAKAECLPATLYSLFPNKRHILHRLWETVFIALMQELENVYSTNPQENRLESLCSAYIDFWLKHPDDYIAIFTIADRPLTQNDNNFIDDFHVAQRLDIFVRAISEAQALGQLQSGDPIEINNILLCCIQGVAFNLITIPEYPWGNPERIKNETIRIMLNGMKVGLTK